VLVAVPAALRASEEPGARAPEPAAGSAHLVSVIAETRDFDQLAVEGAWRPGGGRLSLFGCVGYLPQDGEDERLRGIAVFSGGARVHTSGLGRRGYVELSWGPLERALRASPVQRPEQFLVYGPSLLLGYQSVAASGLTFLAAAGYGYTRSSELGRAVHNPELRLGVGYTWGRARAARRRSQRLSTRASASASAS
jgi:hypothetical protein